MGCAGTKAVRLVCNPNTARQETVAPASRAGHSLRSPFAPASRINESDVNTIGIKKFTNMSRNKKNNDETTKNDDKNECEKNKVSTKELAFLGDAVFELMVREKLVKENIPFARLGKKAAEYSNARAQANMYHRVYDKLTSLEQAIIKRGRNLHGISRSKNACVSEYRHSTGLEVLFGYLYKEGDVERLGDVFGMCVESVEYT